MARKRQRNWAWARTSFDLEGIGGAAAGLLVGLLLGWIWAPLFWLGVFFAVLALLATRADDRVTPDLANIVVAPCDGVIHSVDRAAPPMELRLEGDEWLRVRISSSPVSTNPIYASITGQIASLIEEEPDASRIIAAHADDDGLAVAHITLKSLSRKVGVSVSTGGLGPRLDMISEAEDSVRAGRVIGKRRLGGWCDLYLRADSKLLVSEGQTLIGAETVLCRLDGEISPNPDNETESQEAPPKTTESDIDAEEESTSLDEVGEMDRDDGSPLEDLGNERTVERPETETEVEDAGPMSDADDVDEADEMVANLFKKLKENEDLD